MHISLTECHVIVMCTLTHLVVLLLKAIAEDGGKVGFGDEGVGLLDQQL